MRYLDVITPGCVPYEEALNWQKSLQQQCTQDLIPDTILLLEHPPIYTLGSRAKECDLLLDHNQLKALGVDVFKTNRGGEITCHSPGQVVGYPIFNLKYLRKDLLWFLQQLETVLIQCLDVWGISAQSREGLRGVWVEDQKIAAIGLRASRWVTMHGFALNTNNDLRLFDNINPCGLKNAKNTSMQALLGQEVSLVEVQKELIRQIQNVFGFEVGWDSPEMNSFF